MLIWLVKEMAGHAPNEGRPGRPPVFSNAAIQFCLSIKVLFKLPLRQPAGMVASLLRFAELDWPAPDYSTLGRRQKTLKVQIPYRRAGGPLNLLLDAVSRLGVQPLSAGTSVDPDKLAQTAADSQADVVLVSTHNGMALTYAEQLLAELRHRQAAPRLIMGGVLNQDDGQSEEPVDVSAALHALGIETCTSILEIKPLLFAAADHQGAH